VLTALQHRSKRVQLAIHQQQLAANPLVDSRGSTTAELYVEYALSCMGESESGIQFENQLRFANHKYSYLYRTEQY